MKSNIIIKQKKSFTRMFDTIEKQRTFMDKLFIQFNLKTLNDWKKIQKIKIIKNGGASLITYYYNNDLSKLLQTIYPNHKWEFEEDKSSNKYFKSLVNQRSFMDNLFKKLQLKSLDDWEEVSLQVIKENGGKSLVTSQYNFSKKKLLLSIYPEHHWLFDADNLHQQRKFLDHLYYKFDLKSFEDWNLISQRKFIENGAKILVDHYENNIKNLLQSVYPFYPWSFSSFRKNRSSIKSIQSQQLFMDHLYYKLNFNSLDDFLYLKDQKIIENGGEEILSHYSYDLQHLFTIIYPHYPWRSRSHRDRSSSLRSLSNQQLYMDHLFHQLKLNTFEEWFFITKRDLKRDNKGRNMLKIYKKIKEILKKVYPNFPWSFPLREKYFKSIDNQRKLMNYLYRKFELKKMEDWKMINKAKIIENGGKFLFLYYHDISSLLSAIYPNYFQSLLEKGKMISSSSYRSFRLVENQCQFMTDLFYQLNLVCFDDWLEISLQTLIQFGAGYLISYYYHFDLRKLLLSVYPNYPWKFENNNHNDDVILFHQKRKFYQSIDNQRALFDYLFKKFQLKTMENFLTLKKSKLKINDAKFLLDIYSNNFSVLLTSIYPNYPWNFSYPIKNRFSFRTISHQRKFMKSLFKKLKLKSIDDWLGVPPYQFNNNGGRFLLSSYYNNNFQQLLLSIYPFHPWKFSNSNYSITVIKHRKYMDKLYDKLQLNSLNDWPNIKKSHVNSPFWLDILSYYNYDMKKLLLAVYPHHPWNFENMKYKPYQQYTKSIEFFTKQLKYLQKEFSIREKKDWYRLQCRTSEIDLYHSLKTIYPNERWKKKEFLMRGKKAQQRLLFIQVQKIYPKFYIIENYRPFFLMGENERALEYDIFVPPINIAFEYQGEQHYDDMPGAFGQFELFSHRDLSKVDHSFRENIKLIRVPYWWDHSISSLLPLLPFY